MTGSGSTLFLESVSVTLSRNVLAPFLWNAIRLGAGRLAAGDAGDHAPPLVQTCHHLSRGAVTQPHANRLEHWLTRLEHQDVGRVASGVGLGSWCGPPGQPCALV